MKQVFIHEIQSKHPLSVLSVILGVLLFTVIIAMGIFFISVQGGEQTMVPNLKGKDLIAALLELQNKELYPRIQVRYSASVDDKGLILEQEPVGGTIVKAGRRIRLVVSQGTPINAIENYIGRNVDEVRIELQSLFGSQGMEQPLLSLKEPVMYTSSSQPEGTIIEQKPEAGASLLGPSVLEVVVSRGETQATLKVPNLVGMTLEEVAASISANNLLVTFSLDKANAEQVPETVVSQKPAAGTIIPALSPVSAVMATAQDPSVNEVFSLFSYTLPQNSYPLQLQLDAILPSGERRQLVQVQYPGGAFTFPYRLPLGSILILSMLGREIYREPVEVPVDRLFLDQL
ncbi:MAG: PASTA domain-containing protein [Spirochaetaceae bacterium]|jgi:beta-lactam-binding protein with PASTA domain|nr:PASTA domain-containing protein [Spirochaetaceae bacterium]